MKFTSPVKLCNIDLADHNLKGMMTDDHTLNLMDGTFTSDELQAVIDFIAGPPAACVHKVTSPEQLAASDEWASLNAKLTALPVPADPDAYADLRARLTSAVAGALARAQDAGGLV